MSKSKIILIIFVFTALFYSCKQGKFSIHPPKDWTINDTVSDTKNKSIKMYEPANDDTSKFQQNIMAWFTNFPDEDIYMDRILKEVKKGAYIFENKGKGEIKINGYTIKWRQNIIQLKKNGTPVEQKCFYLKNMGNVYLINCSANVNKLDSMSEEINYVLNSFKIL